MIPQCDNCDNCLVISCSWGVKTCLHDIWFCCVDQGLRLEPLRKGEMLFAYMEIFTMQSQHCSDRSKNNDTSLYSTADLNPGLLFCD